MAIKMSGIKAALISVIVLTLNRKQDLLKCLQSLLASDYKKIEIIVVDNGNISPISCWLNKILPKTSKIKVVRSDNNLGAAGGRNLGIKFAKGDFLLFIDDDAKADRKMVSQLNTVLKDFPKAGIVQPKIYDMEDEHILQGIGCDINLLTGRVSALGIREKDIGQYDNMQKIATVGCVWMVKKEVIKKAGGYDEEYFIPYEDLDFSFRVRKLGYEIYFAPKAIAWHRGVKSTFINPLLDYIGIRSVDRAYRIARNKMIFMGKHSPWPKNFIFFFFFMPIYTIVHSFIIIIALRLDILYQYWLGVLSGLWYILKDKNYGYFRN